MIAAILKGSYDLFGAKDQTSLTSNGGDFEPIILGKSILVPPHLNCVGDGSTPSTMPQWQTVLIIKISVDNK